MSEALYEQHDVISSSYGAEWKLCLAEAKLGHVAHMWHSQNTHKNINSASCDLLNKPHSSDILKKKVHSYLVCTSLFLLLNTISLV